MSGRLRFFPRPQSMPASGDCGRALFQRSTPSTQAGLLYPAGVSPPSCAGPAAQCGRHDAAASPNAPSPQEGEQPQQPTGEFQDSQQHGVAPGPSSPRSGGGSRQSGQLSAERSPDGFGFFSQTQPASQHSPQPLRDSRGGAAEPAVQLTSPAAALGGTATEGTNSPERDCTGSPQPPAHNSSATVRKDAGGCQPASRCRGHAAIAPGYVNENAPPAGQPYPLAAGREGTDAAGEPQPKRQRRTRQKAKAASAGRCTRRKAAAAQTAAPENPEPAVPAEPAAAASDGAVYRVHLQAGHAAGETAGTACCIQTLLVILCRRGHLHPSLLGAQQRVKECGPQAHACSKLCF